MSELSVDLTWNRKESELLPGKFSSEHEVSYNENFKVTADTCLLYTSPSPRDQRGSRMPSSA